MPYLSRSKVVPRGGDGDPSRPLLRWRGDESLEIYARLNNSTWAEWTSKLLDVAVKSTISSRLNHMDFSEETRRRFDDVARAMLTMGSGTARRTTDAL